MNEVIETMMGHRSVRTFTSEAVPEERVRAAVAAGQMASTSSNVQAYCLIRVRGTDARRELAELAGPQQKVAESAAFFVVCGDSRRHRLLCNRAGSEYDQGLEAFVVSIVDASLFAQNMCVAFESMGYGICYIGGLRNDLDRVRRVLDLPEGVYPIYGLCVGVPAESPIARPRLPVEAVLMEERYAADDAVLDSVDGYDAAYREYLRERGAPDAQTQAGWGAAMAKKYVSRGRAYLAEFFTSQGASLD